MTDRIWTDEQLSAFLDGELTPQEMEALSQDLEADAALAGRMEKLGTANAVYRDAIGGIDNAPLKASLKAAMDTPPTAQVIAFKPRSISAFVMEHRAIAASLLCAAAVWGVTSATSTDSQSDLLAPGPDGLIVASSPLHQMLEVAATGEVSKVGNAAAVPRLTFAADDGAFCRQFDVTTEDGSSAAIACREDGVWRTQVVAYQLAKPLGEFQTASAARAPALEAFLDAHMPGAPLNAEQEAMLLQRKWAPSQR
ncbi:MAG: hypothetical protein B7Y90_12280 [Alphaproteobacteria bacterium 32-64-14]|nr:MAG: hypothetical protein B7Y90_12280 [Alphaproteobacteria bacterium 32-64-14]